LSSSTNSRKQKETARSSDLFFRANVLAGCAMNPSPTFITV
jgi:hypothetical protein